MIRKIVSGGQTGADMAALDFAITNGIPRGGWLPRQRMTEMGPLPDKYGLQELTSGGYSDRTERNVIDSDGTVIVSHGPLTGGSALTEFLAARHGKPLIHIDLGINTLVDAAAMLKTWIEENGIQVMNVAGPRASNDPEIYGAVMGLLEEAARMGIFRAGEQRPSEYGR